ncbi:winged helix-turn-helix transcriptional regulator [Bacillus vallismortis]|nr:winged helix-turn-helix transcriptional regulator [Bacillus vallismortis]
MGVIDRIVYDQVPSKVECELREYSRSLEGILGMLRLGASLYGDTFSVLEESVLNVKLKQES